MYFHLQGHIPVSVTLSQQVISPNYIKPYDVRKAEFTVNVADFESTEAKQDNITAAAATQAAVKDVYVDVIFMGI